MADDTDNATSKPLSGYGSLGSDWDGTPKERLTAESGEPRLNPPPFVAPENIVYLPLTTTQVGVLIDLIEHPRLRVPQPERTLTVPCPTCRGYGFLPKSEVGEHTTAVSTIPCCTCNGTGWVEVSERVALGVK